MQGIGVRWSQAGGVIVLKTLYQNPPSEGTWVWCISRMHSFRSNKCPLSLAHTFPKEERRYPSEDLSGFGSAEWPSSSISRYTWLKGAVGPTNKRNCSLQISTTINFNLGTSHLHSPSASASASASAVCTPGT